MSVRRVVASLRLVVAATLLASTGALKVTIKEYDVPSPKVRPHEQMANKLGRLDPNTGQFREYPLKTPDSGPHGLVADQDGNIWFAAIFKGYLGKLDPKTGNITEYRVPGPRAKDPHTPVFDQKGILWFTLQESSMIGRLDPRTGDVKVEPTPHSTLFRTELS